MASFVYKNARLPRVRFVLCPSDAFGRVLVTADGLPWALLKPDEARGLLHAAGATVEAQPEADEPSHVVEAPCLPSASA